MKEARGLGRGGEMRESVSLFVDLWMVWVVFLVCVYLGDQTSFDRWCGGGH